MMEKNTNNQIHISPSLSGRARGGSSPAFLEIHRQEAGYRPVHDRIHDFGEVEQTLNTRERKLQASRCMDCGVPFCHWACPLGNKAPEWNDALYKGDWELAYRLLNSTNPFPEFTGRICPALCEKACVLNRFNHEPATNRENEAAITEMAFQEGFILPRTNIQRNGKRVAVIGAGPAGLAAANDLNLMGYMVTVFEKNEAAGGLLRYGIPNFKLNKAIIDRRIALLEQEGIEFKYGEEIMFNVQCSMFNDYDAVVISTGTPTARDLKAPGRELKGVHFALDLLSQQNRVLAGIEFSKDERISAKGKDVLVIGGGDTGSDCIGTAHRQGCKSVTQIEIMPRPVEGPDDPQNPWPNWPRTLKTTSSHEEGCTRRWNINTLEFLGENGRLMGVKVQEIGWKPNPDGGRPIMVEKGKPEVIKAELCLLAMGFLKPEHPEYPENVFVCGDSANGASLVVRALASGRQTAQQVHDYLINGAYESNKPF
jgi:glutamate synthase (NADPH/NADH) small chain